MSTIPSRLVRSARHGWWLARIEAEATSRSSFCHCRSFASGSKKSGEDHHAFFQEQLLELEKERQSFFGDDVDQEDTSTKVDAQEQHAFFAQEMEELNQQRRDLFGESTPNASFDTNTSTKSSFNDTSEKSQKAGEDLDEIHLQREAIFQFSDEEKQAWSQQGAVGKRISPQLMMEIAEARAAQERGETYNPKGGVSNEKDLHHASFSHVSQDGDSVHMVDVGHKKVTTRMAEAQTKVILPNSVMEAFGLLSDENSQEQQNELIGPKGPILATAKLAGIMAAKKTCDLIPLCHPLPLDQVKLNIRLVQNEVLINCICRVTHKTGVEMEALTGASVAALTVYDMVKAVSHEVEITDTKLVAKTGGKRTIQKEYNNKQ